MIAAARNRRQKSLKAFKKSLKTVKTLVLIYVQSQQSAAFKAKATPDRGQSQAKARTTKICPRGVLEDDVSHRGTHIRDFQNSDSCHSIQISPAWDERSHFLSFSLTLCHTEI